MTEQTHAQVMLKVSFRLTQGVHLGPSSVNFGILLTPRAWMLHFSFYTCLYQSMRPKIQEKMRTLSAVTQRLIGMELLTQGTVVQHLPRVPTVCQAPCWAFDTVDTCSLYNDPTRQALL